MIRVHAMNKKEMLDTSNGIVERELIRGATGKDIAKTVMCDTLFGAHRSERAWRNEDLYSNTAVINFPVSVLNPFLAKSDGSVFKKIIGSPTAILRGYNSADYSTSELNDIDNEEEIVDGEEEEDEWDDWDDIFDDTEEEFLKAEKESLTKNWVTDFMYGQKVLDVANNKIVLESEIDISRYNDYMIGGDALLYIADKFLENIDDEIMREVIRVTVLPAFSDERDIKLVLANKRVELQDIRRIPGLRKEQEDKYLWLWEDYYLENPDKLRKPTLDKIKDTIKKSYNRKGYFSMVGSRAKLLLSIKENPNALRNLIMNSIVVCPKGIRDDVGGRTDALTSFYNKLLKEVNQLKIALKSNDILNRIKIYSRVMAYTSIIMVNKHYYSSAIQIDKSFKSLVELLKGKKGIIRGKMQSVRIDYSGRSVISFEPDMPIDTIGLPYEVAYDLMQPWILRYYKENGTNNIVSDKINRGNYKDHITVINELSKTLMVLCGRQPTLHRLGIQAFKIKPVKGKSIKLSPLVVMPFNADFDGDQMHVEMPISVYSQEEARLIMSVTKNLAYPKDGSITIIPRHEILYGLWASLEYSTMKEGREISMSEYGYDSKNIDRQIFEDIKANKISVYDTISFETKHTNAGVKAGRWAISYIFGKYAKDLVIGAVPLSKTSNIKEKVTDRWCREILANIASDDQVKGGDRIVNVITDMTTYGFAIAEIFPPKLAKSYVSDIEDLLDDFNMKVSRRDRLVKLGIDLDSAYTNYFTEEFSKVKKKVESRMLKNLGDSGFISMMNSGAKGSKSNLLQMFGMKGQIMKDASTAFNAIIKSSLESQLTPLEHFISAYGSRQGIADKTLETAGQGYLTRQLEHSGQTFTISVHDCEDTEGLHWKYSDLYHLVDSSVIREIELAKRNSTEDDKSDVDYSQATDKIVALMSSIIMGRYVFDNNDGSEVFVDTEKKAVKICREAFDGPNSKGIRMRSPITCLCPTCQKCYGQDLTNLRRVSIPKTFPRLGTSIQNIAAQAIGEPGTQLTMKNFQKGGVVSVANLTSSATKVNNYFKLADTSSSDILTNQISYDPIATANGYIKEVNIGNGTKEVTLVDSKGKKIKDTKKFIFDSRTELKDYVVAGESYQLVQGDLNMTELLNVKDDSLFRRDSVLRAAKYLMTVEWGIFNQETTLNMKHFEVIVSGLIRFNITSSNRECENFGFKVGDAISMYDANTLMGFYKGSKDTLKGYWALYGINEVQKYKNDFFNSFFMERITENLPTKLITNPTDSLDSPIVQLSFGMRPLVGTYFKDYTDSNLLKDKGGV